jgi:hypothetical protein
MMALYENDYIIVIRVIYGTVLYVVTHTPEIGRIAKKDTHNTQLLQYRL